MSRKTEKNSKVRKMFRNFWCFISQHDPIWLTIIYMFFAVGMAVMFVYFPHIDDYAPNFFSLISFTFLAVPIFVTIIHLINYRKTMSSLLRIASLYLQIVMMFSVIYFYSVADDAVTFLKENPTETTMQNYEPAISEINIDWMLTLANDVRDNKLDADKDQIARQAFLCFYDCFHFSLVTSTTLGYGDMAPKIFTTKVIVDIQVLASFFLIAFGAGNFFARNGARRIGNNVSLAVEDEEKLKDVLKRQEKISSQLEKLLSEKDQNNKTS